MVRAWYLFLTLRDSACLILFFADKWFAIIILYYFFLQFPVLVLGLQK